MATVVLRPTGTTSFTGWNVNPAAFFDDNLATSATQNNVTCNWTGPLADLDGSLSGATINSFTISLTGRAGRAGASTVTMIMVHSSDGEFASEAESFSTGVTTETTSARTTQQDGSSALTFTYINDCSLKMDPNTQGIQAFEYFVTVDYTAAPSGYGHEVNNVASASIAKVKGVATASIGKVIGVD